MLWDVSEVPGPLTDDQYPLGPDGQSVRNQQERNF